jgi:hypothetical protein
VNGVTVESGQTLPSSGEFVWDAGIDYLVLTSKGKTNETAEMEQVIKEFQERACEYGEKIQPVAPSGFKGHKSEHTFFGRSEWGAMLWASGSGSRDVAAKLLSRGVCGRCARIDCQTTIQCNGETRRYVASVAKDIGLANTRASGLPCRNVSEHLTVDGGSGISIGRRNSSRSGVVYDKSAEQRAGCPAGLVRFESRYTGQQGRLVWASFGESECHSDLAKNVNAAYFKALKVQRDWMAQARNYDLPSTYKPTGGRKKMAWVEKQVSSTVAELFALGYDEQLEAWFKRCKENAAHLRGA